MDRKHILYGTIKSQIEGWFSKIPYVDDYQKRYDLIYSCICQQYVVVHYFMPGYNENEFEISIAFYNLKMLVQFGVHYDISFNRWIINVLHVEENTDPEGWK